MEGSTSFRYSCWLLDYFSYEPKAVIRLALAHVRFAAVADTDVSTVEFRFRLCADAAERLLSGRPLHRIVAECGCC